MHGIIQLQVNGDRRTAGIPAHYTLLETLRYALGLTGSKQGCDKGDCGACTVLLDGEPVLSCITPAWEAEGRDVRTVEGIAAGPGALHPLQEAFEITGGAQCGFCTPGVLMSAYALLQHNTAPSMDEVRDALSGNLCRCTGYTKIFEAVVMAGQMMGEHGSGAGDREAGRNDSSEPPGDDQDVPDPAGGSVPASDTAVRPNPVPGGQEPPHIPAEKVTEE